MHIGFKQLTRLAQGSRCSQSKYASKDILNVVRNVQKTRDTEWESVVKANFCLASGKVAPPGDPMRCEDEQSHVSKGVIVAHTHTRTPKHI